MDRPNLPETTTEALSTRGTNMCMPRTRAASLLGLAMRVVSCPQGGYKTERAYPPTIPWRKTSTLNGLQAYGAGAPRELHRLRGFRTRRLMGTPLKVLILEDRAADAELAVRELRRAGYDVSWKRVGTEAGFQAELALSLDVILLDYKPASYSCVQALAEVQLRGFDIPCIVVAGGITDEQAVQTLTAGACDYVLKDRLARLAPAVKRALEVRAAAAAERRAQADLRQSQAQLSSLLRNVRDAVWSMDAATHRFLYLSHGIEAMTGYAEAEYLSDPDLWGRLVLEEDRQRVFESTATAMKEGQVTTDFRLRRKDGQIRYIQARGWLAPREQGLPARLEGILVDLTDLHTAQTERERAEATELQRQAAQQSYRQLLEHSTAWVPDASLGDPGPRAAEPRSPILTKAGRRLAWTAAGIAVALPSLALLGIGPSSVSAVGDVCLLAAAVVATVACVVGSRKVVGSARRGWSLMAVGLVVWTLGQAAYVARAHLGLLQGASASVPDVLYLSAEPLFWVGMVLLSPVGRVRTFERLGLVLDGLLAAGVLFLAAWTGWIRASRGTSVDAVLTLVYPSVGVMALAIAFGLVLRGQGAWRSGLRFLVLGIVCLTAAQLILLRGGALGNLADPLSNAGWSAGVLLVAAGALARPGSQATDRALLANVSRGGFSAILPVAAILGVAASLVWHAFQPVGPDPIDLALYCALLAVAAARLLAAFREGFALWNEKQAALVEIERESTRTRAALQTVELAQSVAHLGSWQYDYATDRLSASPEHYRIHGLDPSTALDRARLMTMFHPDDRKRAEASFEASLASKTPWQTEARIVMPDGSHKWVAIAAHHLYESKGQPFRTIGTTQDITERKSAEEEVLHERTLLRQAEATAELGSWTLDLATGIPSVSEEFARIFGLPNAFPKDFADALKTLVPDDRERFLKRATREFADPALSDYEDDVRVSATRGSVRDVHVVVHIDRDAVGKPVRATGIAQDVTQERTLERDRLRLAQQLAAVVESSDEAIFSFDLDGIVKAWNKSAERTFGYSSAEMIGRSVLDAIVPETEHASWRAGVAAIVAGERLGRREVERRRKDGEVFPASVLMSPVRDADGRITGVSVAAHDISVARRAAAAQAILDSQNREVAHLRELSEMRMQFLNVAAHDLNTPLTPVVLQLAALRHNSELSPQNKATLDILDRNIQRFRVLVQDMLDSARLQGGRLNLKREAVPLQPLIDDAVNAFREPARLAGLTLTAGPPTSLVVDADAIRISQVMYNLVSNAVKYTPKGGAIAIGVEATGDTVTVRVRDTGLGLTQDQMAQMFAPFARFHENVAGVPKGTGLGLYISKGIVEQHGGQITVASDGPGKGSTFTVVLPASPGTIGPGAAPREPAREPAPVAPARPDGP